ncbi:hypothetical protein DYH09_32485, partial [bacterium CPR1]|nr:hypothetical protein [bacterium CPR1]
MDITRLDAGRFQQPTPASLNQNQSPQQLDQVQLSAGWWPFGKKKEEEEPAKPPAQRLQQPGAGNAPQQPVNTPPVQVQQPVQPASTAQGGDAQPVASSGAASAPQIDPNDPRL